MSNMTASMTCRGNRSSPESTSTEIEDAIATQSSSVGMMSYELVSWKDPASLQIPPLDVGFSPACNHDTGLADVKKVSRESRRMDPYNWLVVNCTGGPLTSVYCPSRDRTSFIMSKPATHSALSTQRKEYMGYGIMTAA